MTMEKLPDEIILLILRNVDCSDILNFSTTCSRFNDVVKSEQGLWKTKYKQNVPQRFFKVIENECDGDWLNQTISLHTTKRRLYNELEAMSPKLYLRTDIQSPTDVKHFFNVALSKSTNYYYTIHVLQELLKKGKRLVDHYVFQKPFTLTEMYYAKIALQHLMHTFLIVKWIKLHKSLQLDPVTVLNIFIQFIDTENLYLEEDVEEQINQLVAEVVMYINTQDSTSFTLEEIAGQAANCPKTQRIVLDAVSTVIYKQRCMTLSANIGCLDSFDIVKVIKIRNGISVVIAAIYVVVASRLGVECDLVAFPTHLFVEWQDNICPESPQYYIVDVADGKLHPKRVCRFSDIRGPVQRQPYSPDLILQFAASFVMFNDKNILIRNVEYLLDSLVRRQDKNNPHILPFLHHQVDFETIKAPLSIVNPNIPQLELISTITHLYVPPVGTCRHLEVKKRNGSVKYAVGMLCYHRKYDYICVIRGWDQKCMIEWNSASEIDSLERGVNQPFYIVVAVDQHERYVAEENLREVTPSRLHHLEAIIGREFSYFDGFTYVPNHEKQAEYPEDYTASNQYKNKHSFATRFPATVPNYHKWGVMDGNH